MVLCGSSQTMMYNLTHDEQSPLCGVGANKRVKVDISRTEKLCFKLENRPMFDS